MSNEPTYEDEVDAGEDYAVGPGGEVGPFRGDPGDDDQEEAAERIDYRAAFLDWFDEHFNTVEVSGDRERAPWCPEWWLHPEVVARLWALYLAWINVEASESVAALSDWWLNHWDRHRAILFDGQTGPFRECDAGRGHLVKRMREKDRRAVAATLPPDEWTPPKTGLPPEA